MTTLRPVSAWALFFLFFIAIGCENKTPTAPPAPTSDKIESMEEQIKTLKREVVSLKIRVGEMMNGSADVSTEEKGYSIAQTKYGAFAVVCKNVTPYLDGYMVQLSVGNLTSAAFNGAKIGLIWGEDNKTKEVSVTNSFLPGRYTSFEVVLTPAKPQEIKQFTLTLEFNQIALY